MVIVLTEEKAAHNLGKITIIISSLGDTGKKLPGIEQKETFKNRDLEMPWQKVASSWQDLPNRRIFGLYRFFTFLYSSSTYKIGTFFAYHLVGPE